MNIIDKSVELNTNIHKLKLKNKNISLNRENIKVFSDDFVV